MTADAVFRAAWIVPIVRPPIRDGWIAVKSGRIVDVGAGHATPAAVEGEREIDLGPVALLPGLVNAHTHLELGALRGLVPAATSMPDWVRSLLRVRASIPDTGDAAGAGADEAVACGTAALADVSNSLVSVDAVRRRTLDAVVFHEVLGFAAGDALSRAREATQRAESIARTAGVRVIPAPHAPYSTSPDLIRLLVAGAVSSPRPSMTIHVGESEEEVEFLRDGTGAWRTLLSDLGAWDAGWRPPRQGPAAYLETLGVWRSGALAVHGVHLTDLELQMLAGSDATLVTCPRSNRYVGAGDPPVHRFLASGVRIAVGTDSLASAPDLNVFAELKRLRELAPDVPARTLLAWATLNGAVALGFDRDCGSLEAGKRARFLAVRVREGYSDIEEALLGGVTSDDIRWAGDEQLHPAAGAVEAAIAATSGRATPGNYAR